jgi:hypothetical protein
VCLVLGVPRVACERLLVSLRLQSRAMYADKKSSLETEARKRAEDEVRELRAEVNACISGRLVTFCLSPSRC